MREVQHASELTSREHASAPVGPAPDTAHFPVHAETTPSVHAAEAPPRVAGQRDRRLRTRVTSGLYHVQAALLATAFLVPSVATIITAAAYLQPSQFSLTPWWMSPVAAALINLAITWALLATPASFICLASPSRVNSRSFNEISSRLRHIQGWLDVPPATLHDRCTDADVLLTTVRLHLDNMWQALQSEGMQWLFGYGYLSLWSELNYVDSLVAYLEARESTWARAKKALWRMTAWNTLGAQEMIDDLRHATTFLVDRTDTQPDSCAHVSHLPLGAPTTRQPDDSLRPYVGWGERTARACVAQISYLLHEKRTDTYAGFVRSRNILVGTCGMASLVLYMLFWLAIVTNPDGTGRQIVVSTMFFYFIGAGVGLFNLLYVHSGLESMIDDYSLAAVRVMVAPQLAGLAALLGVILASLATNYGTEQFQNLVNMAGRPVNVLAAAGFALSPGLVLARFRRHTEQAKRELQSSKGTDRNSA